MTSDGGAIIAIDSGQFGFLKVNNIQNESVSGDINNDNLVNVQDVVLVVNFVLSNNYESLADLNSDGALDVLDVVLVVNLILN